MASKVGVRKVSEKTHNILPKYNYGTGAGWCIKRETKRIKRSGIAAKK